MDYSVYIEYIFMDKYNKSPEYIAVNQEYCQLSNFVSSSFSLLSCTRRSLKIFALYIVRNLSPSGIGLKLRY